MRIIAALMLLGVCGQTYGAIISNGTIKLGINEGGPADGSNSASLNVDGDIASITGQTIVGLRFIKPGVGEIEYTSDGCECEGWGVADLGTGAHGFANDSSGSAGLTELMFSSTATNAQSVTSVSPVGGVHLKVTHTFLPSSTSNLYEVQVKIENIGDAAATDVQYVRVMDWDVEPTPFSEFVEIGGLPASNLVLSHDNGFSSSDPTTGSSALDIDSLNANYFGGPFDHGAYFLFSFGALAPEGVAEFSIFYGAANSRREALAALGLVGAEVYSLGTPDRDPSSSDFSVAIFGFKGVGGDPLPTVPEPSSLLLCGLGMMGVLAHRRKK